MPTPVVMVRTVTDRSLDWWAVVGGVALGGALVLVAAAARLVKRQRVAAHGV
jgi:Na+/H+ antiporter NhaD/arsenite permease-like protein